MPGEHSIATRRWASNEYRAICGWQGTLPGSGVARVQRVRNFSQRFATRVCERSLPFGFRHRRYQSAVV